MVTVNLKVLDKPGPPEGPLKASLNVLQYKPRVKVFFMRKYFSICHKVSTIIFVTAGLKFWAAPFHYLKSEMITVILLFVH